MLTLPNSSGFLPVSLRLPAPRVNRLRRRAVAAGVSFWLALVVTAATALASPRSPVVVVLGLQEDGRPVARARSAVTQHLLHMGESVLAPALSTEDLLCTGNDCLQRLARAFRADRLVGGEILPNDRNYIIRLWMLDLAQQQPSSIEERCIGCAPEQVYELAARGAGKLIDAAPVPAAPAVPPSPVPLDVPPGNGSLPPSTLPSPPPPTPLAPPPLPIVPGPAAELPALPAAPAASGELAAAAPRCSKRFYSFRRGLVVGALGGLTAVGLATAVGLTATDGAVYLPSTAGYPGDITWNNQSQYRAAYALTALTAVGMGAALIDWRKLSGPTAAPTAQCQVPPSKWTFTRGVAIGALGSALLSGLLASVALTALDGRTYTSDDPSRITAAIPYHFQTAYAVGYAASAGLALGFGLAIGLP